MWNLTAGGREGILFIFLQAKLRTAKQTKIGTASITDSAAVQQLDCNSHLCSTFPDEFLPDPVGQWWQTLFSDVKHIFLKLGFLFPVPAQICASINAGSSASCSVSLLLRAF